MFSTLRGLPNSILFDGFLTWPKVLPRANKQSITRIFWIESRVVVFIALKNFVKVTDFLIVELKKIAN
jgi:hypothetical protein